MKHIAKIMAALLAVCLLLSLATVAFAEKPNPKYKAGKEWTINKMASRPTIDGKLDDWSSATKVTFTQSQLEAGDGFLWSPSADGLLFEKLPDDGNGTAYLAWDEEYFYFALDVEDDKNENKESIANRLWAGDCLQIQIGKNITAARYEIGFAISNFGGSDRRLGFQWYPTEKQLKGGKAAKTALASGEDYVYYIVRSGTHTVYEIALSHTFFGADAFAAGSKFPFAFSLHLQSDEPDDTNPDGGFKSYFMEWGDGVVGGVEDKILSVAPIIVCGGKSDGGKTNPTTKATTTTTKKANNTTAGGKTPATTAGGKVTPTTTKAPVATKAGETTAAAEVTTTTEEPTTTTEEIVIEGKDTYTEENATDVEDAEELAKMAELVGLTDVTAKAYVTGEDKFVITPDTFAGILVKKEDGTFEKLEGVLTEETTEDGETISLMEFAAGKDATIYVVKELITTTEAPATTTVAATTAPTEKGAATTTAAATEENGGTPWGLICGIIAGVAVIGGLLWFLLGKRKKDDDEEETKTEE